MATFSNFQAVYFQFSNALPFQCDGCSRRAPLHGSSSFCLCWVVLLLSIVTLHRPFYFSTESRPYHHLFIQLPYLWGASSQSPLRVLGNPIHISSCLFPLYSLISPSGAIFHFLEPQCCIHSKCLLINPCISQPSLHSSSVKLFFHNGILTRFKIWKASESTTSLVFCLTN